MSAPTDLSAETALQEAIIAALGADEKIRALLGDPPRIFEASASKPATPYLEVSRHETRDRSGDLVDAQEHVVDLRLLTRWNGRSEARTLLGEIRRVIDAAGWPIGAWRVVYCHAVYSDVLALRDGRSYRGVLRLRAMTQRV